MMKLLTNLIPLIKTSLTFCRLDFLPNKSDNQLNKNKEEWRIYLSYIKVPKRHIRALKFIEDKNNNYQQIDYIFIDDHDIIQQGDKIDTKNINKIIKKIKDQIDKDFYIRLDPDIINPEDCNQIIYENYIGIADYMGIADISYPVSNIIPFSDKKLSIDRIYLEINDKQQTKISEKYTLQMADKESQFKMDSIKKVFNSIPDRKINSYLYDIFDNGKKAIRKEPIELYLFKTIYLNVPAK